MALRDQLARSLPVPLRRTIYNQYRAFSLLRNRITARDGVVTLNGVRLHADAAKLGQEVVDLILRGDYEGREARMVRMFLEPEDVVIELGAGIGYIGMLCAQTVGVENVHSFEANPLMEPVIRANYALNAGAPHLSIGFLTDHDGEATLHVPELFWAASTTPMAGAREVRTPCIELNRTVAEIRPSFLIMDIEGGEIDVIQHLAPSTIRKVAMELHPGVVGEEAIAGMEAKLRDMGFERRWISNAGEHAYYERAD
ncbi:methyltransferase, FkbM family [Citreicella sp. SE45]|nr:methyltransferase, FkbM family [Citreicella sp. SE45]